MHGRRLSHLYNTGTEHADFASTRPSGSFGGGGASADEGKGEGDAETRKGAFGVF